MDTGLIGIIIGVVGIIFSIVFYIKSLRAKRPVWRIRSNNLISDYQNILTKLLISYDGNQVADLTVSKIVFWNSGQETIDRDDIQTANPLRVIVAEGLAFLDVKVLQSCGDSANFSVRVSDDRGAVFLDFDYLDKNHGALIQVVHNGKKSEDISIVGDIKGISEIVNQTSIPAWFRFFDFVFGGPRRIVKKTKRTVFYFAAMAYAILLLVLPISDLARLMITRSLASSCL